VTWLQIATIAAALIVVDASAAQQAQSLREIPKVPSDLLARPVTLAKGIGHAHDAVGTKSQSAQAFYDQGLAYLHSYVWIEAARSFNQVLREDPSLAIAHAGLSLAYTELNDPAAARAAIERAQTLGAAANDHDKRHIEARRLQMAAETGNAAALSAYRAFLDEALKALPNDVEFWLLRGNAASPDPADRGQGSVAPAIPFYDKARALAPDADAPLHFLTHAYENNRDTARSAAWSAQYAKAAPSIPHAHHMHGHVLVGMGQVAAAIAEYESADRIERAYLASEKIAAQFEWHHEHNLDLLAASYAYLGRMQQAEQAFKEAFALPTALAVQAFNKRNYPAFLTSRGRVDAARTAAAALVAHPSSFARVAGHIEAARALMGAHRPKEAADASNAALTEVRSSPPVGGIAAAPFAIMQSEFLIRTNQRERGEPMLRQAVRRLRTLTGPDSHMDTVFTLEAIARAMREAGAWDLAAWVAGQMIEYDPNYAGSQFASALSLEREGNTNAARQAFTAAVRLWASADADLAELRLAREKSR
jgi:tetratricopeptide (TPR) repeat protein